jgi:hypothetical protein
MVVNRRPKGWRYEKADMVLPMVWRKTVNERGVKKSRKLAGFFVFHIYLMNELNRSCQTI